MTWGILVQEQNWMSLQLACLCYRMTVSPTLPSPTQTFFPTSLSFLRPCSHILRIWHLDRYHAGYLWCVCSVLLPEICSSLHSNQWEMGCLPSEVCTWPCPSLEYFGLGPKKESQLSFNSEEWDAKPGLSVTVFFCEKGRGEIECWWHATPWFQGPPDQPQTCPIGDWLYEPYVCPFVQASRSWVSVLTVLIHHRLIKIGRPLRGYPTQPSASRQEYP